MFKCAATADNPWRSFVNGRSEGTITIEAEQNDGTFTGRHHGHNEDISGNCFERAGNEPHKIIIRLPRTGHPRFIYMGVINDEGKLIAGHRITFGTFSTPEGIVEEITRDEVWTGVKTT